MRRNAAAFLSFCVVGAVTAGAGTACLALLTDGLGLYYLRAYFVTFFIMNAASFFATRRFAFTGATTRSMPALLRYYAVAAAGLLVNAFLLWLLVSVAGFWYLGAALFLTALNAPVNFVLHRRFTFGLRDG